MKSGIPVFSPALAFGKVRSSSFKFIARIHTDFREEQ
jgi:hypothetical protein